MKIGFFTPNLCIRGTSVAVYQYAYYNQTILNNESQIFTLQGHDMTTLPKFQKHFKVNFESFYGIHDVLKRENFDWLYIIKEGRKSDGVLTTAVKCLVHAVFCHNDPHGDKYVYVSDWLAKSQGYDPENFSLPHIVEKLPYNGINLRRELNIPEEALVFGCYGGATEFNLNEAWAAIYDTVKNRKDIYFIFMNINKFCQDHPQIIHLPGSWDLERKASFIHTCDAMIHARRGGETFGCAVAEFSIENKPVITYELSYEKSHIEILNDRGIYYKSYDDLMNIFNNFSHYKKYNDYYTCYKDYTPEKIMAKFNKFLTT